MNLHPHQQEALDSLNRRVVAAARRGRWMHHPSWDGLHVLPEPEDIPYGGPTLHDVAPPGVHALIAYRNLHRNTGVLDDSRQDVQK
jgi:hypothetical protein